MLESAYDTGRRYAREYWACPCMECLRSFFGYCERRAYFFRQGFHDQAKLDDPLDYIDRLTTCAIGDIIGGCPRS